MCHKNRPGPVQDSPGAALVPQPRDISPKRHRSGVEPVNPLPVQERLWVLKDKLEARTGVLGDNVCNLGLDTGQVRNHADFAESLGGRRDNVMLLAPLEGSNVKRGGTEMLGLGPGCRGEVVKDR